MYSCLYNEQEKDFEIAKELNLENGKVVEQLWNNFKKLLPKGRTKLKEVDVSGERS